ncbi:MAG: hypothetical protein HQ513_16420 [Rhodospirillales bacterium]|nr:hypothetical protein [Rhodospirillales bacterium]
MHRFILKIENFFRNPYFEAVIGIILLITGLAEAGDSIYEDVTSGNVGAHHGVILLGFVHVLKAIPVILSSFMLFIDAERKEG